MKKRRGLTRLIDEFVEVMGTANRLQQIDFSKNDEMTALSLKICKDEIRKMKRGDELFIEQRGTTNEATLMIGNEAN